MLNSLGPQFARQMGSASQKARFHETWIPQFRRYGYVGLRGRGDRPLVAAISPGTWVVSLGPSIVAFTPRTEPCTSRTEAKTAVLGGGGGEDRAFFALLVT